MLTTEYNSLILFSTYSSSMYQGSDCSDYTYHSVPVLVCSWSNEHGTCSYRLLLQYPLVQVSFAVVHHLCCLYGALVCCDSALAL